MKLLFFMSMLLIVSCSTVRCRYIEDQKAKAAMTEQEAVAVVFKYDGSKQCNMGQIINVETMAKELAGIKVLKQSKRQDGLMRTAVCGAPTGYANVYEISKKDLDKALAKGFKVWEY